MKQCDRCGSEYVFGEGGDKYCHGCAHDVAKEHDARETLVQEVIRLANDFARPMGKEQREVAAGFLIHSCHRLAGWKP